MRVRAYVSVHVFLWCMFPLWLFHKQCAFMSFVVHTNADDSVGTLVRIALAVASPVALLTNSDACIVADAAARGRSTPDWSATATCLYAENVRDMGGAAEAAQQLAKCSHSRCHARRS